MDGFFGGPCQTEYNPNGQNLSRCSLLKCWLVLLMLPAALIPRMASGRARCTRKLRTWVVEQVESGQFPGVCWEDAAKTMFRIPWKHAGKQDFREDQDAAFFKVKGPGNRPLLPSEG